MHSLIPTVSSLGLAEHDIIICYKFAGSKFAARQVTRYVRYVIAILE
jgi:hypothetical protein